MSLGRHVALAVILPAMAACGQPPENVAPDARAPSEAAQALFETLEQEPATSDAPLGLTAEQNVFMDESIARDSKPGEVVADWQNEGMSQRALLATRPGNATALMLEATSRTGLYRIYPGDPAIETLIPRRWVPVGRYGERRESAIMQIEVAQLSPKVIAVARIGIERLGNATCPLHNSMVFYADPAVPASQRDVLALAFQLHVRPEADRLALCAVWEESGRGLYRTRFFNRAGHRIPQLDANPIAFRVVPRAPFP